MPHIEYLGPNQKKQTSYFYRLKSIRDSIYHACVARYNVIADAIRINQFFSWLFSWNLEQDNDTQKRRYFASTLKDITLAQAQTQSKHEQVSLMQRAIFSGNVLIAALGLNFAYVVAHLVTLWGFHIFFKGAVGLSVALGIMSIPILIYFALAISDAIDEIKRNLVYERLKEKKREKIHELEEKLRALLDPNERLIIPLGDHYKQLSFSNNIQAAFEGLKKSSRWMVLFTILLALEWAVGVSTGVFVGSAISGAAILVVDWRAQRKVSKHDVKIREMNQKIAVLRRIYVARKIEKTPNRIRSATTLNSMPISSVLLFSHHPAPAPLEPGLINNIHNAVKPHLLKIDNLLALSLVTAGYVAYSMITIFATHEHVLGAGSALADGLLYGIPGLFALLIGVVNVFANNKLYEFYRSEKFRLQGELDATKRKTLDIIRENSFNPDLVGKLNEYMNHVSEDPYIEEYCQAPKKWYKEKESFKKLLRVLTMAFFFFGVGLLSSTGIGVVIAIGLIAAGLDYYVRAHKGKIESELKELQKQQLISLKVQEILVDNLATVGVENAVNLQVHDLPENKAANKNAAALTVEIPNPNNMQVPIRSTSTTNNNIITERMHITDQSTSQQDSPNVAAHLLHSAQNSTPPRLATHAPILDSYAMINARENANHGEYEGHHASEEILLKKSYDTDSSAYINSVSKSPAENLTLLHTWKKSDQSISTPAVIRHKTTLVN